MVSKCPSLFSLLLSPPVAKLYAAAPDKRAITAKNKCAQSKPSVKGGKLLLVVVPLVMLLLVVDEAFVSR